MEWFTNFLQFGFISVFKYDFKMKIIPLDAMQAFYCDPVHVKQNCQRVPLKESHVSNTGLEDPDQDDDDYLGTLSTNCRLIYLTL